MTSQPFFALVLLIPQAAPTSVEQLTPEERAKLTVRLRTVEIETRLLMPSYEKAMQREMQYRERVRETERRVVAQGPNQELAQVAQAHKDSLAALAPIKERLEELELDRIKLLDRLGLKDTAPLPTDPTLEKILDMLTKMEKRLQQLERRK